MMSDRFGGVCKMCARPFTIFKWRPGRGEGYKKTEVIPSICFPLFHILNLISVGLHDLFKDEECLSDMYS